MPTSIRILARVSGKRRATTLIELLVVISIIALLISMLLPSLKRTMELAKTTICMHHLREIGNGLSMYGVENDGWLPAESHEKALEEIPTGQSAVWFLKLFPAYLEEPMALTCPSDPFRYRMVSFKNKSADQDVADYSSYGISSLIMLGADGRLADLDRNGPSRPGDTILLADLGPDHEVVVAPPAPEPDLTANAKPTEAMQKNSLSGPQRNGSLLSWDDGYDPLAAHTATWLTARHGHGINVLTVGGGVRTVDTTALLRKPIAAYYKDCAAGGCALCRRQLDGFYHHYSFAKDRLYWWVGPIPPVER